MSIFELAPAIKNSREIVRAQTNKAVLRLVPEVKTGQVAGNKTFATFLLAIFITSLLSLLIINTALARDAFLLGQLKQEAQLLTDQREAILREVAAKSSPDQLAERAAQLGMVASTNPRFLDMSVGKS
jgi:predicted transcriptional regulator